MDHDVYCGAADPPDCVPALLAGFLIDPVFFQDSAVIGKHAGGERKGNAVLPLIQAVLPFIPLQPHGIYSLYMFGPGKQGQREVGIRLSRHAGEQRGRAISGWPARREPRYAICAPRVPTYTAYNDWLAAMNRRFRLLPPKQTLAQASGSAIIPMRSPVGVNTWTPS